MNDRPNAADFGALGYRDEMPQAELVGKHIDGVTGLVFATEEAYLNHTSPVSGHKPTELEHLELTTTPEIRNIADAALQRGTERAGEEVHPAEAAAAAEPGPQDQAPVS